MSGGVAKGTGNDALDEAIAFVGYAYDPEQDIFYSHLDAWQRDFGYCRLYDEAAAPLGMILDCEPIYFKYGRNRWLIELWKGQYDLTCGGEIGIYKERYTLDIPGIMKDSFYECAANEELLHLSFTLKKNGVEMLRRDGDHWWLTGFKLGEYSEPSELSMDARITLIDEEMRDAFVDGLHNAGYSDKKITIDGNTVSFLYDEPLTKQPSTRTKLTDWIIQKKNHLMCEKYQEITGSFDNIVDKLNVLESQAPGIHKQILNVGVARQLGEWYEIIKDYLYED